MGYERHLTKSGRNRVKVLYISLNLIDLSNKSTFYLLKTEFQAKNCLLEIRASNLEGPFIYEQASNEVVFSNKKKKVQKNIFGFDIFSDPHCFCSQFNTNMGMLDNYLIRNQRTLI